MSPVLPASPDSASAHPQLDSPEQTALTANLLPPDAAARDAAKREEAGVDTAVLSDEGFTFVTRGVSDAEKAAVIGVLTQVRSEETHRVRRVERREHQPWARSQRVPVSINDLLLEG